MTRGPETSARLLRALGASAAACRVDVTLEPVRETRWESATFSGVRHVIAAAAPTSPDLEAWLAALPELDLPMPGQFVAGVELGERFDGGGTTNVAIHALTIAA